MDKHQIGQRHQLPQCPPIFSPSQAEIASIARRFRVATHDDQFPTRSRSLRASVSRMPAPDTSWHPTSAKLKPWLLAHHIGLREQPLPGSLGFLLPDHSRGIPRPDQPRHLRWTPSGSAIRLTNDDITTEFSNQRGSAGYGNKSSWLPPAHRRDMRSCLRVSTPLHYSSMPMPCQAARIQVAVLPARSSTVATDYGRYAWRTADRTLRGARTFCARQFRLASVFTLCA